MTHARERLRNEYVRWKRMRHWSPIENDLDKLMMLGIYMPDPDWLDSLPDAMPEELSLREYHQSIGRLDQSIVTSIHRINGDDDSTSPARP